ncbi:phage tail assembly protein [Tumebacillus flagellatus]|uniref:Phage tail assembly protein n=1 Tax=Tumebacillus flagellatus TaxID=1157490 RepID=A0A074LRJ5_9BACL|nr:phage tail assembly protein [Tumebacillus flagellatus]KEO84756.1 hypothetical protein EL26_01735 [Tumebacillus flagellatus]
MTENKNIFKLSKSVNFDGKEYTELTLAFGELTGSDILAAEAQYLGTGGQPTVLETSKRFQAITAAKVAKVPVELIYQLSAKDFSKITMQVQNFLLA